MHLASNVLTNIKKQHNQKSNIISANDKNRGES